MKRIILVILPNGKVRGIYDDALAPLLDQGSVTISRVSHVEPKYGGWCADLIKVRGPFLGPFKLRQEALDAEIEWVNKNLIEEVKA